VNNVKEIYKIFRSYSNHTSQYDKEPRKAFMTGWLRVGDGRGSAGMVSDVEGTCAGCCAAGVVSGNKGVLLLVS